MRVVVPKNIGDCTLLISVCQQQLVEFSYTDPVEAFDMYRLGDEVLYKRTGEALEQEYLIKGFVYAGKGHPQWKIQHASE